MAGLVRPRSYPIRRVTDNAQSNGPVFNPLRFPDHGGFSSASKLTGDNPFSVEAPTKMRTSEKSDRSLSE
jgi:hypothetical protein